MNAEPANSPLGSVLLLAVPTALALFVFGSMGQWEFKWFLVLLAAVALLASLPLFGLLIGSEKFERALVFLLALSFALQFADFTIGFREKWPWTVMVNGYNIKLTDLVLLYLALLWWGRLRRGEQTRVHFPPSWLCYFAAMALFDVYSAVFVAREPFFAWSLIFRELKTMLMVWFLANYLRPEHFRLIGFGFALVLLLEAVAVLDQQLGARLFTEDLLKTATSIKSAAGAGYLLRFGGTMGHPNTLATFLNTALLWVWFMLVSERTLTGRFWLFAALVAGFAALMASGSRGAWLGLGFVLALGMLLWMHKSGKNVLLGAGVMGLTVTVLFTGLFAVSSTFRDRLTKDDRGAALVRQPLSEVAVVAISEHPWRGVGLGQYTREMHRFDHTNLQVASWYNQPVHNTFLLTAAETGVPALLVVLLFLSRVVWDGWQTFRRGSGLYADAGLTAMLATIAWALQEMANPDYVYMPTILWFAWAVMLAAKHHEASGRLPA